MKRVRFYCDVPEYAGTPPLYAMTQLPPSPPHPGHTRIAFQVDIPDGLLKSWDLWVPDVIVAQREVDDEKH